MLCQSRSWGGIWPGQMIPTDQRDISYHRRSCSEMGRALGQLVVSSYIVHHLFWGGLFISSFFITIITIIIISSIIIVIINIKFYFSSFTKLFLSQPTSFTFFPNHSPAGRGVGGWGEWLHGTLLLAGFKPQQPWTSHRSAVVFCAQFLSKFSKNRRWTG